MSSYLLFLLLGLGAGAVYAILGLGLVLEYRSSGVINFAQGAIAMFIAYTYIELRKTGRLMLPVVGLPYRLRIFSGGIATVPALLIALVVRGRARVADLPARLPAAAELAAARAARRARSAS